MLLLHVLDMEDTGTFRSLGSVTRQIAWRLMARNTPPVFPSFDVLHGLDRDTKFPGNDAQAAGIAISSEGLLGRQFAAAVCFANGVDLTTLAPGVRIVLGNRSEKQVAWIYTATNIALVANDQSGGYFAEVGVP